MGLDRKREEENERDRCNGKGRDAWEERGSEGTG